MRRDSAGRHRDLIADRVVHGVGLTFAIGASVALAASFPRLDPTRIVGLAIYMFGLLATFGCSALYNLTEKTAPHSVFRRLDHAAIFVMIAGTYTPLTLFLMATTRGHLLLAFVWTGAVAGVVAKLFFPVRAERFSVVAYLLLGWAILGAIVPIYNALPASGLLLLAGGGLFYSFGVIFHIRNHLPYQNALWHACVLAGAVCHFGLIWRFVAGA
jgi:hemolysin III